LKALLTADFNKDISKLHDKKLLLAVKTALQRIEAAHDLSDVPNLKKMQGTSNYFRLRINDYRISIFVGNDKITVVRLLHRKEIYRYFP
jgi:mRNA interferase RelE/StbE